MTIIATHWEDTKNVSFRQASENAIREKVVFCGGKFIGFFVEFEPYYGISLLVYDAETKLQILQELGIHYCTKVSDEERIQAERNAAKTKLFDVNICCNTQPCNYWEYRKRFDFVVNIYPKRYKSVSGWYIGKPDAEQVEAAKKWFFCPSTMQYFKNENEAMEVHKCVCETRQRHMERLNDMEYVKQALIDEFYNYECMYGERYDEAAIAVGIDLEHLTESQNTAYKAAYREFWQQVNKRGDY